MCPYLLSRPAPSLARSLSPRYFISFFFNDTATTEIYTLSLHDALPIYPSDRNDELGRSGSYVDGIARVQRGDRKSTRLNSSHANISYAVFCLKKKRTRHLRR